MKQERRAYSYLIVVLLQQGMSLSVHILQHDSCTIYLMVEQLKGDGTARRNVGNSGGGSLGSGLYYNIS